MLRQVSPKAHVIEWSLAGETVGEAVMPPVAAQFASIQFSGEFGGASVQLEVSNDGANWWPVKANAEWRQPGLFEVWSAARLFRATSTGGNGDTAIGVSLTIWELT